MATYSKTSDAQSGAASSATSHVEASQQPDDNPHDLERALQASARQEYTNMATQLDLLVRFDEIQGWRDCGARNCVAWMNSVLHIDRSSAFERLRVGKKLRELPCTHELFRAGDLSWSKVRLISRIASPENEKLIAHASLDASVSDVERICQQYRWQACDAETDRLQAEQQYQRRRLGWKQMSDGNTCITLVLPPIEARHFLIGIEHCENLLYQEEQDDTAADLSGSVPEQDSAGDAEPPVSPRTPAQRRADAAVRMAERSLASTNVHTVPADRYQVVLNVDIDSLDLGACAAGHNERPVRKPFIEGIGPVTVAAAQRFTNDCHITAIFTDNLEPLGIGRKSRIWPAPIRRAIHLRDGHCQFPGCSCTSHLHIHHLEHWTDGGETSVENGVLLCNYHHQLIHKKLFEIERVDVNTENAGSTEGLKSSAKRTLLPTRCKFRVVKVEPKKGKDGKSPENAPFEYGYAEQKANHCCRDTDNRTHEKSLRAYTLSAAFSEQRVKQSTRVDFNSSQI